MDTEKSRQQPPEQPRGPAAGAADQDAAPVPDLQQGPGTEAYKKELLEIQQARDAQREQLAPKEVIAAIREKLTPGHREELDPSSPSFDREQWEAAEDELDDFLDYFLLQEPDPAQDTTPETIIIETPEYNPKLDPASAEFDFKLWKENLDSIDFNRIQTQLQGTREKLLVAATQLYSQANSAVIEAAVQRAIKSARASIEFFKNTDFTAAANAATDVITRSSEIINNLITPEFLEQFAQTAVKIALDLPPEELKALQEEIEAAQAEEEEERNRDQITLFDDPEADQGQGGADDTGGAVPEDFIQLFGEKPIKEKRQRKTPILDAITEQAGQEVVKGYILQGKATNALTKARPTKLNTQIDKITGDATIKSGDIVLRIKHYNDIADPRTSTYQLLDSITETLAATGRRSNVVELPLTEYMEKRGLKDRKETRKQVEEDLETLYNASISLTENRNGKEQNFLDMRICDAKGIKNGIISFSFGTTFFSLIKGYAVMYYPEPLYKINGKRNPYSYPLGRRIAEHKNMNAGKKNEDVIAVKTLLKACDTLPSKKEVANTDRAFTRRIIEPFERDLNALEDVFSWEYCHRNGTPLTQQELNDFSYETFEAALILVHWKNYPDQTKRLEAQQARIDEAKAAAQARQQKRKRGRPPKKKD